MLAIRTTVCIRFQKQLCCYNITNSPKNSVANFYKNLETQKKPKTGSLSYFYKITYVKVVRYMLLELSQCRTFQLLKLHSFFQLFGRWHILIYGYKVMSIKLYNCNCMMSNGVLIIYLKLNDVFFLIFFLWRK